MSERISSTEIFSPEKFVISGNLVLFNDILNPSKENIIAYVLDTDGVLSNSPKEVISRYTKPSGIHYIPAFLDGWHSLTNLNNRHIELGKVKPGDHDFPESGFYDPEVLGASKPYHSSERLVNLAINQATDERTYILTAREEHLMPATKQWFGGYFPQILEKNINRSDNKEEFVKEVAQNVDWVIVVDDAIANIDRILKADIPNCFVVNVPLGVIRPDFEHPNLLVIQRYPELIQDIYPLCKLIEKYSKRV